MTVDPLAGSLALSGSLIGFALLAGGRSPATVAAAQELGAAPDALVLEVHEGGELRRIRSRREALIGRAPSAAVRLGDPTVSRLHARIERRDGQTYVEDLGSRNGTLVNGKPISREAPLQPGDRVRIGSADIVLVGVGQWK
jgi:pSer/pThr/pTyr-binding forkhead associated (FHA) protein